MPSPWRSLVLSILVLVSAGTSVAEPRAEIATHDGPHLSMVCDAPPPEPDADEPDDRPLVERGVEAVMRVAMPYLHDGYERRYNEHGQLESEMTWVDGKLHGDWIAYRADGSLFRFDQYDHGVRQGLREYHFEDGSKTRERYRQGRYHGWNRQFDADGRVVYEGFASNDHGLESRSYRHEDGSLSAFSRGDCDGNSLADWGILADGRFHTRDREECETAGGSFESWDIELHSFRNCRFPPLEEHLERARAGEMPLPCGLDLRSGTLSCGLEGWPRKIYAPHQDDLPPAPGPKWMGG